MRSLFKLMAFATIFSLAFSAKAQTTTAAISGDFPDPSIIHTANGYYAVGTSSEWAPHYPVYHSVDLKSWKQTGYVFDKTPDWIVGSFWAPEYYKIKDTYYIYYTARRKSDNISCIGVATSKYPDHGFTDHGVIIDHGKEAIDAFIYNDKGQLYISFKAYGLDNRPIELLAQKVTPDGLKAYGETISLLKDDNKKGMEGQSFLKHGKYYYLFYSAGGCCGIGCSYHVKVARATKFAGPYEKYEASELLKPADGWKCSGHGTFTQDAQGRYYYIMHAYNQRSEVFTGREGMLATLNWDGKDGWPTMKAVATKHPYPDIHDKFIAKKPALYWQYDFHNAAPVVTQGNGKLSLSGTMLAENKSGIMYGIRPVSDHFEMSTTVTNHNEALKGLAFYGTTKAILGLTTSSSQVKLWLIKDGNISVLDSAAVNTGSPVQLKFSMMPDRTCKAWYKQGTNEWKELATGNKVSISELPQWDRPQRIGLFFKGTPNESAVFSEFDLVNKAD
ncbi:MAG: family 43 glycosylhydrolase [Mucilaginibacter sp.]|nr:family 43 glycosylhydrolase [Mucilaginibacter sp.]